MMRIVAKSKLHGLRITGTALQCGGSLTLDPDLTCAAQLVPGERVQIVNVSNGERLGTYVIEGEAGSGQCVLNGPAARKGETGDVVHVIPYGLVDADEGTEGSPPGIHLGADNRPAPQSLDRQATDRNQHGGTRLAQDACGTRP